MNLLTKQEKNVLFFLLTLACTGLGIHYFIKNHTPEIKISALSQTFAKIDLNTADETTLMLIPGVGKTLAQRIIAFREENGNFKALEELKLIKGITKKRYEQICNESTIQ